MPMLNDSWSAPSNNGKPTNSGIDLSQTSAKPKANLKGKQVRKLNKKENTYKDLKSGYTYKNFLFDLYGFMVDRLEFTSSYFLAPTTILNEDENRNLIQFGVSNNIFWVVPLMGTVFTYTEIVDAKVREDLLKLYGEEVFEDLPVFDKDVKIAELVSGLTTNYTEEVVKFMQDLPILDGHGKPKTLAICGQDADSMVSFKGSVIPKYNISLSLLLEMLKGVNFTLLGVSNLDDDYVGLVKDGLDGLYVESSGSYIAIQGVSRK